MPELSHPSPPTPTRPPASGEGPATRPIGETDPAPSSEEGQGLKLALELGPLLVFFLVNWVGGIYVATGIFMVVTLAALVASRITFGRIAIMPVVSAVLVLLFGALTLFLQNDTFIKVKPTVLYASLGVLLAAGLLAKRSLLKLVFGEVFSLTETGWRKLTLRWALFFFAMAVLNEAVWRHSTTAFWLSFKIWGFLPLTIVFSLLQIGLIQRHASQVTEVRPNQ